jgi:hypothetical protein
MSSGSLGTHQGGKVGPEIKNEWKHTSALNNAFRASSLKHTYNKNSYILQSISQWPRCLRRRSSAARLLTKRVRIPPRAWMSLFGGFVSCRQKSPRWTVLSPRGFLPSVYVIKYNQVPQ